MNGGGRGGGVGAFAGNDSRRGALGGGDGDERHGCSWHRRRRRQAPSWQTERRRRRRCGFGRLPPQWRKVPPRRRQGVGAVAAGAVAAGAGAAVSCSRARRRDLANVANRLELLDAAFFQVPLRALESVTSLRAACVSRLVECRYSPFQVSRSPQCWGETDRFQIAGARSETWRQGPRVSRVLEPSMKSSSRSPAHVSHGPGLQLRGCYGAYRKCSRWWSAWVASQGLEGQASYIHCNRIHNGDSELPLASSGFAPGSPRCQGERPPHAHDELVLRDASLADLHGVPQLAAGRVVELDLRRLDLLPVCQHLQDAARRGRRRHGGARRRSRVRSRVGAGAKKRSCSERAGSWVSCPPCGRPKEQAKKNAHSTIRPQL